MKLRLTGSAEDFEEILPILEGHRAKFDSWRKPQTGNNSRYKPGGDKYDERRGEQLLMYLDIDAEELAKLLVKAPSALSLTFGSKKPSRKARKP